jgi:protein-S-isoprenylcysteine O-methyltransferase
VGTQLVLCNPLCTVAYAWAAWSFFNDRIPYEEALLVEFYGLQYVNYAKNAVIGIPGIQGYVKSSQEVATGGGGSATEASGGDGVQEVGKRK